MTEGMNVTAMIGQSHFPKDGCRSCFFVGTDAIVVLLEVTLSKGGRQIPKTLATSSASANEISNSP